MRDEPKASSLRFDDVIREGETGQRHTREVCNLGRRTGRALSSAVAEGNECQRVVELPLIALHTLSTHKVNRNFTIGE